jgi:uncharacterized protein YndB with AHSA1/START domain
MNTNNDAYGTFTSPAEVRIVRLLPGPIERLWSYLTVPEKRARWFCGGVTEPQAGGKVTFAMKHETLSPGEIPPPEYAQVQCGGVNFDGRVIEFEPPHRLVYTFGNDDSVVTFELTPRGEQVLLVLTHRTVGADEQAEIGNYGSGWHTHLSLLVAELESTPRPLFWATHTRLRPVYEQQLRDVSSA